MRGGKEGTGGERRLEGVERGEEWRKERFGSLDPFISTLQKQKHNTAAVALRALIEKEKLKISSSSSPPQKTKHS